MAHIGLHHRQSIVIAILKFAEGLEAQADYYETKYGKQEGILPGGKR